MPDVRVTEAQRKAVYERARACCEYCHGQYEFSWDTFAVEHIIPRHAGGPTTLENLALACQGCNGHKAKKLTGHDIATDTHAPLFHPRLQKWSDHFAWSEDFTLIVGTSPIGRVTVAELRMNRRGVVNLRRVLRAMGVHPPESLDEI